MYKLFCRSENDFNKWVIGMDKDRIDMSESKNYPPEKYPCLIIYLLHDIDSMRYAEYCYTEYIYPEDFGG